MMCLSDLDVISKFILNIRSMNKSTLYLFLNSKITFEATYWGSMLIISCLFLGHFHQDYFNTFLFCLVWFPFTIGFTYYLNNVLIKKYLYSKKYFRFFLYLLYAFIVSSFVQITLIVGVFIVLADLDYNKMNPIINDLSMLWFVQLFTSILYSSFQQIKEEQKKRETIHQLEKEKLQIELQLKELELNTLKDQIHPHFLFNTLNNIYGLAIEKSDDLPHILLQLSGLLDYLVYQSKEENVALADEIKVLQQYISLEQLRFDDRFALYIDLQGGDQDIQIIPFLLFPMIENAFKHGIKPTNDSAYLKISSNYSVDTFTFRVENSKPKNKSPKLHEGTGLINLKKRLEICYPAHHQLKINDTLDSYYIQLKINL
ncbi:hypothetical protein EI427_13915 [Flammeovirga pectinis]|uniref:Signal transduction histidine kinase internal region domain-containing protein n=2 Tax=Flammeovirga pectinis TaxID=2494373 RepID=A0A3Q9FN16_9BACT|nr:hypothetical protein EI427_13915 [Flammeovirga pectinis]